MFFLAPEKHMTNQIKIKYPKKLHYPLIRKYGRNQMERAEASKQTSKWWQWFGIKEDLDHNKNVQIYFFVCSIDSFILHQENFKKFWPQNNFRCRCRSWKFQKIKMYAKIEDNNVIRSVKLT